MTLLHRLASIVRWIVRRNRPSATWTTSCKRSSTWPPPTKSATVRRPPRPAVWPHSNWAAWNRPRNACETGRHGAWLDVAGRDVRYGLRQVRRNPAFSAIAIATLALGIGGITAMFSAFDAVLIRPLPYTDADRLVMIWDEMAETDITSRHNSTPAEWIEWRRLNTVFTDLASSQPADATLSGDGEPEQVPARKVTWTFWSVLGVQPTLGRVFTEDEDNKSVRVVVISHGLWQRRFGGASDIIGREISLNDEPYEVIGVMPRNFYFMPSRDIDMWMPASFPPWMRTNFTWHDSQIVARLKPGVTLEHARQSMAALSLQVTAKDSRGPHSVIVMPLREEIAGKTRTALILLLSASAALLLIACVNLTNLLLSRGAARGREVAVRAALGAGRGRLVAQFLTESLVLAALGTLAGLALALPAMRFLERLVPEAMGAARLTLDWRVLAFSAAAAIGATLIFGLAPALRGSRRRSAGSTPRGRTRHGRRAQPLVPAFADCRRNGARRRAADMRRPAPADLSAPAEHGCRIQERKAPDLRDSAVPLQGFRPARRIHQRRVGGRARDSRRHQRRRDQSHSVYELRRRDVLLAGGTAQEKSRSRSRSCATSAATTSPQSARRLHEGRFFSAADQASKLPLAIVNEPFAARHFQGRSPLGQRFKFGNTGDKGYWYTIVGVVKPIREAGVLEEMKPAVYRLHEHCDQIGGLDLGIVVRTAVEPARSSRRSIRPSGRWTRISRLRASGRWKRSSTASCRRLRKARRC